MSSFTASDSGQSPPVESSGARGGGEERRGEGALRFPRNEVKDPDGRYPSRWERPVERELDEIEILDMASAARGYLRGPWLFAIVIEQARSGFVFRSGRGGIDIARPPVRG